MSYKGLDKAILRQSWAFVWPGGILLGLFFVPGDPGGPAALEATLGFSLARRALFVLFFVAGKPGWPALGAFGPRNPGSWLAPGALGPRNPRGWLPGPREKLDLFLWRSIIGASIFKERGVEDDFGDSDWILGDFLGPWAAPRFALPPRACY